MNSNTLSIYNNKLKFKNISIILTSTAIFMSALHFWPFEKSNIYHLFNISNLSVILWLPFLCCLFFSKTSRSRIKSSLPHLSIIAYLSINILSIAFASDLTRAINFTAKLSLIFAGGYMLFHYSVSSLGSLKLIYCTIISGVSISLFYSLITGQPGFHSSPYKYATYISTLAPVAIAILVSSSKKTNIFLALLIIIAFFITTSTIAALVAISLSLILIIILIRKWALRLLLITAASLGLTFALTLNPKSSSIITEDFTLTDNNGKDLKQRYIEWQAEINLLKQRTAIGTAAGCINDQRSNFYFRLPKLNTLLLFDQNGFLATAAETGILGLACFCWVIIHYGKSAISQAFNKTSKITTPMNKYATANLAGFIGACIANIFSSVHYNGVLIAFVLLLALISANQQLMKES